MGKGAERWSCEEEGGQRANKYLAHEGTTSVGKERKAMRRSMTLARKERRQTSQMTTWHRWPKVDATVFLKQGGRKGHHHTSPVRRVQWRLDQAPMRVRLNDRESWFFRHTGGRTIAL